MLSNKDFFFCYDRKLSYWLVKNGCHFITRALSVKDGSEFALFEKTDKLKQLLEQWGK